MLTVNSIIKIGDSLSKVLSVNEFGATVRPVIKVAKNKYKYSGSPKTISLNAEVKTIKQ